MKGILRLILLMFVAAGAAAVQSCSDDRITHVADDIPIRFRTVVDRPTKATSYTQTNLQSFNVTALKKSNNDTHLNQIDFSTTDYMVWSSADEYYWPKNKGSLLFYAYAPKATASNGVVRNSYDRYTVTPIADTDNQIDLVFARTTSGIKDGVSLNFRHVMSQVAVKFKNSNPNICFHVTGWKICGVKGTGTFTYDDSYDTNAQASTSQGVTDNTISASSWTTQGDTTSYIKVLASGYKTVTSDPSSWGVLEAGSSAILVPQDSTDKAVRYVDSDNDSSTPKILDGSYLAIQYEALDVLTNEPVEAAGTWGCWPVSFAFEPGFRYTYVVDLSDFGYKESSVNSYLSEVKDGSKVQFVGVTVDSWQPDGGSEIDLPLAQMVPTTPYLRFHTEDGIQQFYVETAPDFDGDFYDDWGWEIYDAYFSAEDSNLEYSVDEGVSWHQLMSSAHDVTFYYDPDYSTYTNKISFGPNANGDGQNIDLLVRGKKGFHCSYSWKADTLYEYHGAEVGLYYPHFGFVSKNYKVECSGAVTALTDYNNINAPFAYNCQYAELFRDNECLISAPVIPATAVTYKGCYYMFANTGLIELPDDMLPATTLGDRCYEGMFNRCKSLTTLSDNLLPAPTMTDHCYYGMFQGCTQLTSLPNNLMSATTAGRYSCYTMFSQCTSLASLSGNVLPATTLEYFCYGFMFNGCKALTSLTENMLPATVLTGCCYYEMFENCTNLTSIPSGFLPATTLANECYYEMFSGCSGLTSIPSGSLPATTLARGCYYYMFSGCTSLTSIPSGLLPATVMQEQCYYGMFSGCAGLTTVPENLLPATTLANSCYYSMFNSCSKLENAPELPATTLADNCYYGMFRSCSKLENAPALPATTLKPSCYAYMFHGCTTLATAPDLPALSLSSQAYHYMFFNCSGLRYVKALFTSLYGTSSYNSGVQYWLGGTVPNTSECVFVKNSAAVWAAGGSASNINPPYVGIPSNWTMQTVTP